MRSIVGALALAVAPLLAPPSVALAQADYPRRLPTPGGEVIIPDARAQSAHDEAGYAPARRLGDVLYVSGAIVGRRPEDGTDAAAFEAAVRRTLSRLDVTVRAAGATLDDVAMINSFHVWEGPDFTGTRMEQVEIIARVWREFSDGPRPAWTAVGTTGLLPPTGIVEIQLIVHAPTPGAP